MICTELYIVHPVVHTGNVSAPKTTKRNCQPLLTSSQFFIKIREEEKYLFCNPFFVSYFVTDNTEAYSKSSHKSVNRIFNNRRHTTAPSIQGETVLIFYLFYFYLAPPNFLILVGQNR